MGAQNFETKVNYNLKERDDDDTYADDVIPSLCYSYVLQNIILIIMFVHYLVKGR